MSGRRKKESEPTDEELHKIYQRLAQVIGLPESEFMGNEALRTAEMTVSARAVKGDASLFLGRLFQAAKAPGVLHSGRFLRRLSTLRPALLGWLLHCRILLAKRSGEPVVAVMSLLWPDAARVLRRFAGDSLMAWGRLPRWRGSHPAASARS